MTDTFLAIFAPWGSPAHLQTHLLESWGKRSLRGPETELKSTEKLLVAVLADAYPFRATPDEKLARGGTAGEPLALSALRQSVRKVTRETLLRGERERGQKRTANTNAAIT